MLILLSLLCIDYTVSSDLTKLTIKGISTEPITKTDYQRSGTYINYKEIEIVYGITDILWGAFMGSTSLEHISLPLSIRSIGGECFYGCSRLKEIEIPEGVREIAMDTFRDCSSIKKINISSTVVKIGKRNTFASISAMTNWIVHKNNPIFSVSSNNRILLCNTTIAYAAVGAFSEIVIPRHVEVIETDLVRYRLNIRSIKFEEGSSLKYINDEGLSVCKITSLELPHGLLGLNSSIFSGTPITSLVIPTTLESISKSVFSGATSLINITVIGQCPALNVDEDGNIMTSSKDAILFFSPSITKFHIQKELTSIDPGFLRSNHKIVNLTTDAKNDIFIAINCTLYFKENYSLYSGIGGMKEVTVDKRCTEIMKSAFKGTLIEKISLVGSAVKIIQGYAFSSALSLRTVEFCDTVETLVYSSFSNTNLSEILLSRSLNTVLNLAFSESPIVKANFSLCSNLISFEMNTFWNCRNLQCVILPPNLENICEGMFTQCTSLKSLVIPSSVKRFLDRSFSSSGIETFVFEDCHLETMGKQCFIGSSLKNITIPDSVTSLGIGLFSVCVDLREIRFGESSAVSTISGDLISGCNSLTEFTVGPNVSKIEEGGLSKAENLMNIFIDRNNKHFTTSESSPGLLFSSNMASLVFCCGGRASTFIPKSVSTIEGSAFLGCSKMKIIDFDRDSLLQTIGHSTFFGCTNIARIQAPANLETIGSKAFSGCSGLREFIFPTGSKLKTVSERAFEECSSLEKISLPGTIEEVGALSFSKCNSLYYVSACIGSAESGFDLSAFNGCPLLECVHVSRSFSGATICGKPALKALDADCHEASVAFTGAWATHSKNCIFTLAHLNGGDGK